MIFNGLSNEEKVNLITKDNIQEQSVHNSDYLDGLPASEYARVNHNHDKQYAPISHTQSASTISAGTFTGAVKVPASTAYTTAQIRNIVVVANDVGAGVSVSYPNGTIVLCKG